MEIEKQRIFFLLYGLLLYDDLKKKFRLIYFYKNNENIILV